MPLRDLSLRCSMRRILSTATLACQTTWNLSNVMRALGRCSVQPLMKAPDISILTDLDLLGRAAGVRQVGGQRLDRLSIASGGDEQHPALERVGCQGDVVVAAGTRGLVNGQCLHVAEVRPLQGQFDVVPAHRHHPVCRLAHDARHRGKRHLLREHQDQRLEQQGEAGQPAGKLGLDQAHRAIGQLHPRGTNLQVAFVLEEVQVPVRLGYGVVHRVCTFMAGHGEAAASNEIDEYRQHAWPPRRRSPSLDRVLPRCVLIPSAASKSLSCMSRLLLTGRMRQHAASDTMTAGGHKTASASRVRCVGLRPPLTPPPRRAASPTETSHSNFKRGQKRAGHRSAAPGRRTGRRPSWLMPCDRRRFWPICSSRRFVEPCHAVHSSITGHDLSSVTSTLPFEVCQAMDRQPRDATNAATARGGCTPRSARAIGEHLGEGGAASDEAGELGPGRDASAGATVLTWARSVRRRTTC